MTDPAQASPEQMEKRIVELEADNTYLAKTLIEMGEKVTLYVDELEDEGDRIYFGSTNHAEYLRDLCETVFEERVFRNDRFEKPAKGRDLYAEMRELREAKAQSDQQQAELLAAVIALRDDMIARAETNKHLNDGELVVEAGAGVWSRFNRVIEKGRSDAD